MDELGRGGPRSPGSPGGNDGPPADRWTRKNFPRNFVFWLGPSALLKQEFVEKYFCRKVLGDAIIILKMAAAGAAAGSGRF